MERYEYEIFISYASTDNIIAKRLYDELNSPNRRVFLDTERLKVGEEWRPQLLDTLKSSKHIIVLWSTDSIASQWVQKEAAAFETLIATSSTKSRSLINILLNQAPAAYSNYHSINNIYKSGIYTPGDDKIDANLFKTVVNRIRNTLLEKEQSQPIRRAVFTLTKQRLTQSTANEDEKDKYKNSYGNSYSEWKPFGSDVTIETILDNYLLNDINVSTREKKNIQFHWHDIDWKEETSNLWADDIDIVESELNELSAYPSVIVLDPFALNDSMVRERFDWCCDSCFENDQALIMALAPFPLSSDFKMLRQQLRRYARNFYLNYFEPSIFKSPIAAQCFPNATDDIDVKRHLQIILRNQINRANSGGSTVVGSHSAFLRT